MVSEKSKPFDFDEHVRLLQQIVDRYQSEYQLFVMCSDEAGKRLRIQGDKTGTLPVKDYNSE